MRIRGPLILTALIGIAGCGDSRKVDFPVDDGKVMSTLSPSEFQSMCMSVVDSAKQVFDFVCSMEGTDAKFEGGGGEQACQAEVASCKAELQAKPIDCPLEKPDVLAGCAATVGEYEACLNEMMDLVDEIQSKVSCSMSEADMQGLMADQSRYMQVFQSGPCQVVSAKCPGMEMGSDVTVTPIPN